MRGEQESVYTVRLWGASNNCSRGLRGYSGAAGHESYTSHSGPVPRILSLRPSSPRPSPCHPGYQAPRPSARNNDTACTVAFRLQGVAGQDGADAGRRPGPDQGGIQTPGQGPRVPGSQPSQGLGLCCPHTAPHTPTATSAPGLRTCCCSAWNAIPACPQPEGPSLTTPGQPTTLSPWPGRLCGSRAAGRTHRASAGGCLPGTSAPRAPGARLCPQPRAQHSAWHRQHARRRSLRLGGAQAGVSL